MTFRLLGMMILVLALGGCGGGDDGGAADNGSNLPAHFHEMIEHTSDYQRDVLADGVATDAEYEAAILAAVACVEAKGWRIVENPAPDSHGRITWSFGGAFSEEESRRATDDYDACWFEYSDLIEAVWEEQNLVPWQTRFEAVATCIAALGLKVESEADVAALINDLSAAHDDVDRRLAEVAGCMDGAGG